MGKKDIKTLFVLPSFQNGSNSDYHGKICQHLMLLFNQKPRHFNLPLKLSSPGVILVRMLRKHNANKKEVLQAHAAQVQTLQNKLESLKAQPVSCAQPVQGSGSREGPPR
jgi:hypothetical protein